MTTNPDTKRAKRLHALKHGQKTFDPGKPCKHGHVSLCYAKSGQCVACSKAQSKQAYQVMVDALNEFHEQA